MRSMSHSVNFPAQAQRSSKPKSFERRRIILASRSKARRKLLKDIGIRFTVATTDLKEKRIIKTNCADLVVQNALLKVKDVAKRFDSGIIIAADTVVEVGKKIIGKPKNIKDAFKTLKLLSQRPQWVYTGIAVMDIDNGKIYTDFDRTKVYMLHLSDKQIKGYFRRVSPLDKAGSFDIQGFGSVFIDRIEGCFYNVVGLPMAKLSKILNKAGVDVF